MPVAFKGLAAMDTTWARGHTPRMSSVDALRAMRDQLDACDVIVRYAACIDDRDFVSYRACFTEDVELHGFGAEVIRGVDAWLAFVEKTLEPFAATQHMLGPPQVDLDGSRGTLRAELRAEHFCREPRGRIFTLWGTYRSVLLQREGSWRIQRHQLDVRSTRNTDAAPRRRG
jgi:hypothetical protein